ncbi:hypothetical protein FALBO_16876 [Fusarium albosuccineum]|uniref:Myb/SANT-like domain-containing protein n=1 Tax=Fusarium albosuccineum TaxID=1237068 RepID=A0A8H4KF94_9HYPO|nr:hypothetical protein FALBO_16876 [Fusarium albosuccineum]
MPSRARIPVRSLPLDEVSGQWESTQASSRSLRPQSVTSDISRPSSSHLDDSIGTNSRSWHWSDEQELYLLEKLLEARRQGKLKITKNATYTALFKTFIPLFKAKWSRVSWATKMMNNKFKTIRKYWRAFKETEQRSGTQYNYDDGTLYLSEGNRKRCLLKYQGDGRKIVTEGLLISPSINFESYEEIFSDDLPAGKSIHPPTDEAYWQRRRRLEQEEEIEARAAAQEEAEEAAVREAEEEGEEVDEEREAEDTLLPLSQQYESVQPFPTTRSSSQASEGLSLASFPTPYRPTPASSARPRRRPPDSEIPRNTARRSTESEIPPNTAARNRGKRKRDTCSLEDVRELLKKQETQRTHIVSTAVRPEGSEDIERACRAYEEALEEQQDLPDLTCTLSWFRQDPINAVIWNALGKDASKEAWVRAQVER